MMVLVKQSHPAVAVQQPSLQRGGSHCSDCTEMSVLSRALEEQASALPASGLCLQHERWQVALCCWIVSSLSVQPGLGERPAKLAVGSVSFCAALLDGCHLHTDSHNLVLRLLPHKSAFFIFTTFTNLTESL